MSYFINDWDFKIRPSFFFTTTETESEVFIIWQLRLCKPCIRSNIWLTIQNRVNLMFNEYSIEKKKIIRRPHTKPEIFVLILSGSVNSGKGNINHLCIKMIGFFVAIFWQISQGDASSLLMISMGPLTAIFTLCKNLRPDNTIDHHSLFGKGHRILGMLGN